MAYLRKKTVNGREYWYEQETYRVNGEVRTRHISYVGVNCPVSLGTTQRIEPRRFVKHKGSYGEEQYSFDKYDLDQVEVIAKGSDRIVATTPEGDIIKIAITPRGLVQNQSEGDSYAPTPEVKDKGRDYVVVENVARNDKKSKEMLKDIKELDYKDFKNKSSKYQDALQKIDEKYDSDVSSIMNYDVLWGDIQRPSSWGWKNNQPFLIDAGSLNEKIGSMRTQRQVFTEYPYTQKDWEALKSNRQRASKNNRVLTKETKLNK